VGLDTLVGTATVEKVGQVDGELDDADEQEYKLVKLGYNDYSSNEFTIITNKIFLNFWSQITSHCINFYDYSESRFQQTLLTGTREFVISELNCTRI